MPERGRPPSSRSSAWARTVLPAPVSPVMAVRPGPRRSSARSISSRFSTRSSRSMGPGLPAVDDGAGWRVPSVTGPLRNRRDRYGEVADGGSARQAPELLAEAVVEGRARHLCQQHLVVVEADLQLLAPIELSSPLP